MQLPTDTFRARTGDSANMFVRVTCLALLVAVASCADITQDARLTAEPVQLDIAAAQVREAST